MTQEHWQFPTTENPKPINVDIFNKTAKFPVDISKQEKVKAEKDPHGIHQNTPGAKLDNGKTKVWLMVAGFSNALEEVAKVTTVGATKYTENGWVEVQDGISRYMEAFGRHMLDLGKGKLLDDGPNGTNCMHKAQMIWNLLASLELELREND